MLRAAPLMEADFNFANKLFIGKRMAEWAEGHNDIPDDECCRSCRSHQAIDVAASQCLTFGALRQRHIPGSSLSVNASN